MKQKKLGYEFWCEACACENRDELSLLTEEGWLVSRGGTLKVPVTCQLCESALHIGEYAEAITHFHGVPEKYEPWEEKFLELFPASVFSDFPLEKCR